MHLLLLSLASLLALIRRELAAGALIERLFSCPDDAGFGCCNTIYYIRILFA
jgi:hypothetical protein